MSESTALDDTTLERLFSVPPREFVANRNAVAKELRAQGARDAAALIAKLRRPSVVDWALDTAAREQPEVVKAFLTAASDLRDAQAAAVEGRTGGDVRGALQTLRAAAAAVVAVADAVVLREATAGGAQTAALTARLAAVAGNAEAGEQLRAGQLGASEVEAADPFAGLVPPDRPGPPSSGRTARAAAGKATRPPPAAKPSADDAVRARQQRKERAATQRRLQRAEAVLEAAKDREAEAEAAVSQAEQHLDAARARFATAEQRREEAASAVAAAADSLEALED